MRLFSESSRTLLATFILAAALGGLGVGCASRDPNNASYQFPDQGGSPTIATAPPTSSNPTPVASAPVTAAPDGSTVSTAPVSGDAPMPFLSGMSSSVLRIGDMISVSFSDVPPPGLTEVRARIPGDGMLTLHYNVRITAAGRTIPDLERDIRNAYVPKMYRNLTAIVRAEERVYFVGGEVKVSNRYPLLGDMTVLRAIDSAGGFTEFANRNKIELRRQDGTVVKISEKKIKKGEALDLPVQANDRITVGKRLW